MPERKSCTQLAYNDFATGRSFAPSKERSAYRPSVVNSQPNHARVMPGPIRYVCGLMADAEVTSRTGFRPGVGSATEWDCGIRNARWTRHSATIVVGLGVVASHWWGLSYRGGDRISFTENNTTDRTRRLVHTSSRILIHSNYALLTDRYMCAVLCYIASTVLPCIPAPSTSRLPSATPIDR